MGGRNTAKMQASMAHADPGRRCREAWSAGARSLLILANLISAVAILAGCAVSPLTKNVHQFALAVSAVVPPATQAYDTIERTYEETQIASLVLNYDTTGFRPDQVKPFLNTEDRAVRKNLLGALQAYADALITIASDKDTVLVDTASKDLGASLLALQRDPALQRLTNSVTPTEVNLATTAIDVLGQFLINRQRNKRLPAIVKEMQEPVARLGNLLIADLGNVPNAEGIGGRGLRGQLWITYDKQVRDQDAYIVAHSNMDAVQRRQEISRLPQIVHDQRNADATLQAMQETIRRLIRAHDALSTAPNDTTIRERLEELVAQGKALAAFYQGVPAR